MRDDKQPWRSLVERFEGFEANRFTGSTDLVGQRVRNTLEVLHDVDKDSAPRSLHPFATGESGGLFHGASGPESPFGDEPGKSSQAQSLMEEVRRARKEASDDHEQARAALHEARALQEEAQAIRDQAERELEDARLEAEEVIRRAGESAQGEVENRIKQADEEARAILEKALREVERIEADGYQAGFTQGEDAGQRLGEQKIETVVRSLRGVVDAIAAQRETILSESQRDLVKIAFLVSMQLLGRELKQDESVILDVIRNTINGIRAGGRLILQVSPHDHTFLEEHQKELLQSTGEGFEIEIQPVPEISRGGCRVVLESGSIDATLETMLGRLQARLWDQLDLDHSPVDAS